MCLKCVRMGKAKWNMRVRHKLCFEMEGATPITRARLTCLAFSSNIVSVRKIDCLLPERWALYINNILIASSSYAGQVAAACQRVHNHARKMRRGYTKSKSCQHPNIGCRNWGRFRKWTIRPGYKKIKCLTCMQLPATHVSSNALIMRIQTPRAPGLCNTV